ncbi:MAG: nitroreductase [Verrucomicrobia bacterium]|nr:nitroreductase [Verrucomicrobiota bacterium]
MNIEDAIFSRRTIHRFKPEVIEPGLLEEILAAGLWAQNHRLTQPWRFTVVGPETQRALAGLYAAFKPGANPEAASEKIMSKPLLVAVSVTLAGDAQQRREDYGAACCAIQIIQLMAWSRGIGMQWSTSPFTRLPETYDLLHCDREKEDLIGILFFGYPAEIPAPPGRKPLPEVLRRVP